MSFPENPLQSAENLLHFAPRATAADESASNLTPNDLAGGNATVQAAIDGPVDQTRSIERAVTVLKLDAIAFEGSDSLDSPDKVFQ